MLHDGQRGWTEVVKKRALGPGPDGLIHDNQGDFRYRIIISVIYG